MRPSTATLAVLAALLPQLAAGAQTCDQAAFGLRATSYLDSQLNPPTGEDVEFFSYAGSSDGSGASAVPTVYFLLDNSSSMWRLAPNGPGFLKNLPPLNDINCPSGGDVFDQGCRGNTSTSPRQLTGAEANKPGVMGCGLDPESAKYAGGGTAIGEILTRTFSPSCGKSTTAAAHLAGYSASYDYADEAKACPYYVTPYSSFPSQPKLAGYDPDFYCGSSKVNAGSVSGAVTTCPSQVNANFFDKNLVFHETISDGPVYANGNASTGWGFNGTDGDSWGWGWNPTVAPGNGWSHDTVYPYKKSASEYGSVSEFCANYASVLAKKGVTTQAGVKVADLCNTCLAQRGFFFDGYAYRRSQEHVDNVLYASIWLTGNYLNFYPPKFLVARKAMKDLLMNNLHMRAGIAVFDGGGKSAKNAAKQIQAITPACDATADTDANLWAKRADFMTAINRVSFKAGTPLGEALLNVGQLFRTPETPWFGGTATNSTFEPSSTGGTSGQPICFPCQNTSIVIVTDGRPKPSDDPASAFPSGTATPAQAAAACTSADATGCIGNQATGVVDGPSVAACPQCNASPDYGGAVGGSSPFGPSSVDSFTGLTADKSYLNNAIRVAWLFHNFDFRKDDERANACTVHGGKQALNVYTLGFGSSFNSEATQLLGAMASVGGGLFVGAENPGQLGAAFDQIIQDIDGRGTSYSTASVNALHATAGQSVLVPRFNPSRAAFWSGHLYRFELFSEFAAGCAAGGSGDLDCDCACNSVFLRDADGHHISEDATGRFVRNEPNKPTCGPTNHCSGCGRPGTTAAVPYWDAEEQLEKRAWQARAVYTAVDDPAAPDGAIDAKDPPIALIDHATGKFDAEDVAKLLPYMGLTLATGGPCATLSARLRTAGDTVGAAAVARDLTTCAEGFLAFVLGADLFNQVLNSATTSCKYPPPPAGKDASGNAIWDPTALCDRTLPNAPGKLGDVFHSSPVRVLEPEDSGNIFGTYGSQTLPGLWLTATRNEIPSGSTKAYAYDVYAAAYQERRRLVVVGANDGLLHAFDAGNWRAGRDDPALLPAIHTSQAPFGGYWDKGTGDEVWAFLPPDLLAKVPLMLGSQHQFFVDGDPMVRDVWVDGTANGLGGAPQLDDVKQPREFHTVVIGAERRGGTHYFALDVTDATKKPGEDGFTPPRLLWVFPQGKDPKALEMGETYTSFLPGAPPIVPVRLDASTAEPAVSAATPAYKPSAEAEAVRFHERWVAFLPGGFDPQFLRGHGVHVLDVWTGAELFDFSRPDDGSCGAGAKDPRCKLDAPVAGQVGAVAFGSSSRADLAWPPNGGFFDTATFGDTNGALWVLRFNAPGRFEGGKVKNWWGGRAFQLGKASGSGLCAGRQPFFYMTANVPLYSSTRHLRVLAGTGDRFNLLDPYGGTCGPDNLRACLLRGCTVDVQQASNGITVDDLLGAQRTGLTATACSSFAETMSLGTAGSACTAIKGRVRVAITNCPATDSGATGTTKSLSVDCTLGDHGAECAPTTGAVQAAGGRLAHASALDVKNWFVSVRVFEDGGARAPFDTEEAAIAYDGARLGEGDLQRIDGASSPSLPPATADSNGWAIFYDHDRSFTDPATQKTYAIARADERTASPASTASGCVYWTTVQPALHDPSDDCPCGQTRDRLAYLYGADITSGGLCLKETTVSGSGATCKATATKVRSRGGAAVSVPAAPQATRYVNGRGQLTTGMTTIVPGHGAWNTSAGPVVDAVRPVDWLPMSRGLEACRHASSAPPASVCR